MDLDTSSIDATSSPTLDDRLDAVAAEALSERTEDETAEAGSPQAGPADAKPSEAPKARGEDAPTARMLRSKAAELTRLEVELASKRGELSTSEKIHTDKLASADKFTAFLLALKDDPIAALELIGEDVSDFSERLAKGVFGHDATGKKLSGVERQLTDLQAKLAAKEAAEDKAAEDRARGDQSRADGAKNIATYKALVSTHGEKWPALQECDEDELVQRTDAYMKRMYALTGERVSMSDAAEAMEELARKNPEIVARIANKATGKTLAAAPKHVSRSSGKTLAPDASAERSSTRELTLDEKLAATERESTQQAGLVSQARVLLSQWLFPVQSKPRTVSPAKGLIRCRQTTPLRQSINS